MGVRPSLCHSALIRSYLHLFLQRQVVLLDDLLGVAGSYSACSEVSGTFTQNA